MRLAWIKQESAWNKIYEEGIDRETAGSYRERSLFIKKPPRLIRSMPNCNFAWEGATLL